MPQHCTWTTSDRLRVCGKERGDRKHLAACRDRCLNHLFLIHFVILRSACGKFVMQRLHLSYYRGFAVLPKTSSNNTYYWGIYHLCLTDVFLTVSITDISSRDLNKFLLLRKLCYQGSYNRDYSVLAYWMEMMVGLGWDKVE